MWCTALCPISVLAWLDAVSSYLERVSLRYLPKKGLLHKTRRMDPAGFEPASATWTEWCVAVTPRALSGVWAMAGTMATVERQFLWTVDRIGTDVWAPAWSASFARLLTLPPQRTDERCRNMEIFGGMFVFVLLCALGLGLYFLPSFIGWNKRSSGAIIALNILTRLDIHWLGRGTGMVFDR
jgi:hypothetical protein